MSQQIFLQGFTREEFEESVVNKIIDRVLRNVSPAPAVTEDELLTRKQVAKLLNVSLVTVSKWQKNGTLKFDRYATRIRFKKSEVLKTEKFKKTGRQIIGAVAADSTTSA